MLQELKGYLKITWTSEDEYLNKIIERGKSFLNGKTDTELDFATEGDPKSLLLDYCRYYYNNAIEYFEENFKSQLLELKFKEAVRVRVSADEG